MQPSSLVFVAIVVGWAAYLLPQWLRRRETLTQSRTPDRYSAGLRVLDRRAPVTGGPSSVPLLTDPGTLDAVAAVPSRIADRTIEHVTVRPDEFSRQSTLDAASAAAAARRRATVVTALLAVTGAAWVVSVPLPAVTYLAVTMTTLLVLDVAALVVSARGRAARRDAAEAARRREADRRRAMSPRSVARSEPAAVAPARPAAGESGSMSATSAPAPAERIEPVADRVARELEAGGTPWVPVPVPPPTYTLKPAAPRLTPAPLDLPPTPRPTEPVTSAKQAATASGGVEAARTPRPWDPDRTFADDLDLDAVLARRRAVNG